MIFGNIAAGKICILNDLFLSYNIQFVYEYYRMEKWKILYAFNAATSSCRHASFLQFFKVCSVPAVPNLYSEISS